MQQATLQTIARAITAMTADAHGGRFFEAENKRLAGFEATFADSAVHAAQFAFTLDMEGVDEPIPAYAVITRLAEGFTFIITRDADYLEKTAQ